MKNLAIILFFFSCFPVLGQESIDSIQYWKNKNYSISFIQTSANTILYKNLYNKELTRDDSLFFKTWINRLCMCESKHCMRKSFYDDEMIHKFILSRPFDKKEISFVDSIVQSYFKDEVKFCDYNRQIYPYTNKRGDAMIIVRYSKESSLKDEYRHRFLFYSNFPYSFIIIANITKKRLVRIQK